MGEWTIITYVESCMVSECRYLYFFLSNFNALDFLGFLNIYNNFRKYHWERTGLSHSFLNGMDWGMFPFNFICTSMLLYNVSIIDIILGLYPNFLNALKRKFLSTLSKAFFWSSVIMLASSLFMLAKEIMSLFSCKFSTIVLHLIAAVCSVLIISVSEFRKRLASIFVKIL